MAAHKQFLHELLKEDQEPFHLKSYIADRKSQLKTPSPTAALQLSKRSSVATKRSNNLSKHACFLSFQNSPDVRRSPFLDFSSPAKSPNNAVFLHIPSRTAALLVEAAMRIQKQPKSQNKNAGFGLFGSFLKRMKSKNKKRSIELTKIVDQKVEEARRISCSCSNRRLSSADWTENNEDKSMDFEASTSSCGSVCSDEEINGDFALTSPFRFSLRSSPSASGRCTPDFCSPAASPSRRAKQDEKNSESRKLDNAQGGEEEEEKDQCSPVSVLDPPFDECHSGEMEEDDDYDLDCSYQNVQRAKQQLLQRLRRFEKLADLDPIELERKLLEGSDDEGREESEDDEPLSLHKKHSVETFVSQVFNQSSLQCHSRNLSTDMKRLVSDLIVEEEQETIPSHTNDVLMGRIRNRFDSWKEVEFNTIDMMVGLDLKRGGCDGWTKFDEQVEETSAEIAVAIYALLIEELSDELCC